MKHRHIEIAPRYPEEFGAKIDGVVLSLTDILAALDIRISFDFPRNGWVVERETRVEWDADDTVCDPCWAEVAFIGAWPDDWPERTA